VIGFVEREGAAPQAAKHYGRVRRRPPAEGFDDYARLDATRRSFISRFTVAQLAESTRSQSKSRTARSICVWPYEPGVLTTNFPS
jgi:hypothetical protein